MLVTEDRHAGYTYTLTGPDTLTLGDIADELSSTLGRPVRFEDETLEQAHASRAAYGAPAWEVEGWITTYTAIAAGELDTITHDIEQLTGHPPVGVRQYLSTL